MEQIISGKVTSYQRLLAIAHMTSKYRNKNGEKKLLAAILVMALAFAGCAMVFDSEESDAEDLGEFTEITESPKEAPSVIEDAGTYKVTSDKQVTVPATGDVTFYVADKVTITLNGTSGASGEVTVQAVDSEAKKIIQNDTTIEVTMFTGGEMSVKALYSGSTKASSSLIISGEPQATSIQANVGTGSEVVEGTVSVGSSGLVTGVAVTGIGYGSMSQDPDTRYTYSEPGSNKSYNVENGQVVSVMNGTVTVTDGDNTIKFSKYKTHNAITLEGNASGITISGGSEDDTGSISILMGVIKATEDIFQTGPNTFTGVFNGSEYEAQITGGGSYTVYGNYEQKKSVSEEITQVTLDKEAVLVVPENVKMTFTALTLPQGSVIKVFGELTTQDGTEGEIQVGPSGILKTATPDANTNVKSGDDNGRSGELTGVVEDIILTGNAIVPAGKVLTVNGNLGLSGNTLTVEGKIVISEGAVVYALKGTTASGESIILKEAGTIENHGALGTVKDLIVRDDGDTNTITLSGVTGAQFGYATINGSKILSVFGDITTNGLVKNADGEVQGTTTMAGNAAVGGDLTIGKGVTFIGVEGTNVSSGAHMTVEGTLSGEITLQAGAYIQVDGEIDADTSNSTAINAIQGKIDGSGMIEGNVKIAVKNDKATGFKIYSEKTKTEVKVDVSGEIEDANLPTNDSSNPESEVTIEGTIVIPIAGLSVSDEVKLTISTFILEGVMKDSSNAATITGFVGAKYVTETGTGSNKVTTTYYTDIATAMAAIDSAKDKSVSIKVEELKENIVVADKQKLTVDIDKVALGASITAENGSKLDGMSIGIQEIVGSVVIFNNAKCDMELADIAAASIPSTDKTIYAGFETAVGMVGAGETLTVGTVVTEADLVIKEGVTVVAENLTVKGNLTIPTLSALKAQSITMDGADRKVTVYGSLDLSEGNISGEYKLTSPGTTTLSSIDTAKMTGAYYVTETGYVLTSVSKAASQAIDGEVVIIGNEVSETADVVLNGIDLRISSNATKTTIGKIIVLNGAKVIAQGELTATITDAEPVTLGAITSTVSVNGSVITVTGSEDGLQINAVSGKVRVVEGIVTVTGDVAAGAEFSVSEGAQAVITGNITFPANTTLDVQGYLSVKGTLKTTNLVKIAGTLSALTGSYVTLAGGADIVGTLAAEADSSVTAGSNITVRDGATVSGEITLGTNYVKAYAGADVKDMEIEGVPFSAEFYANDLLIVTFYATSPITVTDITADLMKDVKAAISGADVGTTIPWKDSEGGNIGTTISSDSKYYVDLAFKKIAINVSVQNGTELRIGTDYYAQTCSTEPIYYLETPYEISATDLLGNRDVTIEFYVDDVKQEISGGKITFTADMEDKKIVIFSSCGSAPVTPTPVAPVESDDGMELTDYLLIVLVVLAAILVVVVAIRMLRN